MSKHDWKRYTPKAQLLSAQKMKRCEKCGELRDVGGVLPAQGCSA